MQFGIVSVKSKDRNRNRPQWLRRVGVVVLWCLAVLLAMVCINAVGFFFSGKVLRWQAWVHAHANLFLVWRLFLYAGIVAGWMRLRRQILKHEEEAGRDTQWRLSRIELTSILAFVLIETALAMKGAL